MINKDEVYLSRKELECINDLARIPLASAILCLDCEVFYRIERHKCPGCGSASGISVAKILNRAKGDPS